MIATCRNYSVTLDDITTYYYYFSSLCENEMEMRPVLR
jgi:hypothetical protein